MRIVETVESETYIFVRREPTDSWVVIYWLQSKHPVYIRVNPFSQKSSSRPIFGSNFATLLLEP